MGGGWVVERKGRGRRIWHNRSFLFFSVGIWWYILDRWKRVVFPGRGSEGFILRGGTRKLVALVG